MLLGRRFARRALLGLNDGQFAAHERVVTKDVIDSCRQALHRKAWIPRRIGLTVSPKIDILTVTQS